jgi:hypothetical protein
MTPSVRLRDLVTQQIEGLSWHPCLESRRWFWRSQHLPRYPHLFGSWSMPQVKGAKIVGIGSMIEQRAG